MPNENVREKRKETQIKLLLDIYRLSTYTDI